MVLLTEQDGCVAVIAPLIFIQCPRCEIVHDDNVTHLPRNSTARGTTSDTCIYSEIALPGSQQLIHKDNNFMNIAINALSARQGGGQVYLSNLLRFAADYDDLKISCITTAEFAHLYEYPSVEIITVAKSADNVLKRILWEKQKLPALLKDLEADLAFCPGGTIGFTPPDGCKTAATFQNMLIFDKNIEKNIR